MNNSDKKITGKQNRFIAIVIAGSVLFWSIMQGVAPSLEISARYMLLIDFFTLAALAWSLISLFKIFISRRETKG
tara:strand:- start:61 stop:285 length:225 start_codon:yes stop_codon:yes gene_type:complete